MSDQDSQDVKDVKLLTEIQQAIERLQKLQLESKKPAALAPAPAASKQTHPGMIQDGVYTCCQRPVSLTIDNGCTDVDTDNEMYHPLEPNKDGVYPCCQRSVNLLRNNGCTKKT